jgi:hypothetical protein
MHRFIGALLIGLTVWNDGSASPVLGSLEWFADRLKEPEEPTDLSGYYIEFTERKWPVEGDQADLAELEAEVAGRPEHPKRMEYERLKAQLELDGFLWRYRIWYQDDEHWRRSLDTNDPDAIFTYYDAARNGSDRWRWIRGTLTLEDADHMPEDRDPNSELLDLTRFRMVFIDVTLHTRNPEAIAVNSEISGRNWTGFAASADGTRQIQFLGRMTDDAASIDVVSLVHRANPDPRYQGHQRRYEGWSSHAALGRRIPVRCIALDDSDRLTRDSRVISVRELRPDEIVGVLQRPDPLGEIDAVRDAAQIEEVVDRRPSGGHVVDAVSGERIRSLPVRGVGSSSDKLYWIAWITAGGLVAGLIWLRLKR